MVFYFGNMLMINVFDNGCFILFIVFISKFFGNSVLVIIVYGMVSIFVLFGVVIIIFNNNDIVVQDGGQFCGQGKFYIFYGNFYSVGVMIVWVWGVVCIIDVLEVILFVGIDFICIGVIGCFCNGKGVFVVGVFEFCIVLILFQEFGFGGLVCWCILDWQKS